MFLLVVFFPFFGFLYSGMFGRYFGRDGSIFFSTIFVFFAFLISLYVYYEVGLSSSIVSVPLYN